MVELPNPHVKTKKTRQGREYSQPIYQTCFSKHEIYTSQASMWSPGIFKNGVRFFCQVVIEGTDEPCGWSVDILDRGAPGQSGGNGKLWGHLRDKLKNCPAHRAA